MDVFNLGFYAVVCGALAAAGPRLGRLPLRIAAGMLVGLGAAAALPSLRAAIGIG